MPFAITIRNPNPQRIGPEPHWPASQWPVTSSICIKKSKHGFMHNVSMWGSGAWSLGPKAPVVSMGCAHQGKTQVQICWAKSAEGVQKLLLNRHLLGHVARCFSLNPATEYTATEHPLKVGMSGIIFIIWVFESLMERSACMCSLKVKACAHFFAFRKLCNGICPFQVLSGLITKGLENYYEHGKRSTPTAHMLLHKI